MIKVISKITKISILLIAIAKLGAMETSTLSSNFNDYDSVANECNFYENVLEEDTPAVRPVMRLDTVGNTVVLLMPVEMSFPKKVINGASLQ